MRSLTLTLAVGLLALPLLAQGWFMNYERDIEPAEIDLDSITSELDRLDLDLILLNATTFNKGGLKLDPATLFTAIDSEFAAITDLTLAASMRVQACVWLNGKATVDEANAFIALATSGYIPIVLDTLNKTSVLRPFFAKNSGELVAIQNDLLAYNVSNAFWLANLTLGTPPELLGQVKTITANITSAFQKTLAVYGL
ncbi:hypothetical protein C8F01DRAFT_442379 [Mycena amicta]|nr:hypothetical protein C8F01DRAFT_158921 [Mycena amicta]KAJ7071629.1 hypothetical protein C8F01DRAFT_442379 [Mycena amicta]